MTKKIADVYYNVQDMNRSVKFYTDLIGLRVTHQDEHWTSLDANGITFGLHWTGGEPVPPIPKNDHGAFTGATVTFASDDAFEDGKKLKESGVRILGTADEPWGKMVVFEDPDGNILKLKQSPS